MNMIFDSKYCLFFFASPKKYPACGRQAKKATRKPSLRLAGMYIAFSGGASIKRCATVMNNIGSLIGS